MRKSGGASLVLPFFVYGIAIKEINAYILRELISAIYVDAPDKSNGKRVQKIHIKYDLIGYIPVDEMMKVQMA